MVDPENHDDVTNNNEDPVLVENYVVGSGLQYRYEYRYCTQRADDDDDDRAQEDENINKNHRRWKVEGGRWKVER
jgi:hypothetical protein